MFKRTGLILLVFFMVVCTGCGSGIRFSQSAPEAAAFHPQSIAVLPVAVGSYGDAKGIADRIIAEVLADKGWFKRVVSADDFQKRLGADEEVRKVVTEYLNKITNVNFSDPDLSRRIAEVYQIDAFLVVGVDLWNYTVESGKKTAKIGLNFQLVDARSGRIMWKARHSRVDTFVVLKPALAGMAKSLTRQMIAYMPH
ncbi:MAG: hypothetical protein ACE14T_07825 [Syntrophales bacterium]